MKFLLAQPAILRFQWELDVVLTNIRSLEQETPIVLLFTQHDPAVIKHIESRYTGLEIHVYHDGRQDKSYIPTVRPYLWWRYLSEDPAREQETYFQIDSDIIFREMPDWSSFDLNGKRCYASDCSGYIDYNYLSSRTMGGFIVSKFSEFLCIPVELIQTTPGGGAQWLITQPTAQLWWHTWQDCDILYRFLKPLNSDIQKWTAEMWAQLYNLAKFGWDVQIPAELDFCRPTDPLEDWDRVKILHNAGVVGETAQKLFFKGKYVERTPFDENFDWIDKTKAGLRYVEAIKNVAR